MNERIKKFTNSKIFLVGIIILFMILIAATGTYAWLTWSSGEDNTNLTMTIGNLADVFFTSGNDITTGLTPVFNYTDGENTTFSVKTKTSDGSSYNVKLNITSIDPELTNDESVKYALVKNGELVANESLKNVTSGSSISIYNTSFEAGTTSYVFYLYIDGNMENNSNMIGKNISGNLTIELVEPTKLVDHITSLYTSYSNKITATNNSIDYYYANIYDADSDDTTSGGLMNDRLGGVETLDSGTGNIRYYGANPNNYIYFNCDTYPDTNCELWRIIGIFDGKVKLIRNDSIGDLAWDQDYNNDLSSITYKNDWYNSSLQEFLNGLYYNRGETTSHIYYSGSDATTKTTLQLQIIGIKASTRSIIEESTWNLGGWNSISLYSNDIYSYERGNTKCGSCTYETTWPGKIALMYSSDYGYATDFTKCIDTQIGSYGNDTESYVCRTNTWLFNNENQWLLAPDSIYANYVWYVNSSGGVDRGNSIYGSAGNGVRPTLYLNPETSIGIGHKGTSTDPYRISVS